MNSRREGRKGKEREKRRKGKRERGKGQYRQCCKARDCPPKPEHWLLFVWSSCMSTINVLVR